MATYSYTDAAHSMIRVAHDDGSVQHVPANPRNVDYERIVRMGVTIAPYVPPEPSEAEREQTKASQVLARHMQEVMRGVSISECDPLARAIALALIARGTLSPNDLALTRGQLDELSPVGDGNART